LEDDEEIKLKIHNIEKQLLELGKILQMPKDPTEKGAAWKNWKILLASVQNEMRISKIEKKNECLLNDMEAQMQNMQKTVKTLKQQVQSLNESSVNNNKIVERLKKVREDQMIQKKILKKLEHENITLQSQLNAVSGFFEKDSNLVSQFESKVRELASPLIFNFKKDMLELVKEKVDTVVLEELVNHIVTKEELKKSLKKTSLQNIVEKKLPNIVAKMGLPQQDLFEKSILNQLKELEANVTKRIDCVSAEFEQKQPNIEFASPLQLLQIESKVQKNIQGWTASYLQRRLEEWSNEIRKDVAEFLALQSETLKSELQTKDLHQLGSKDLEDCDWNPLVRQLTRDFDEKLYVLCSELTSCKTLLSAQNSQPFYRCAQWLWNSGSLKMGSAVPWNLETANTGNFYLIRPR
jgi:hypothetical protein